MLILSGVYMRLHILFGKHQNYQSGRRLVNTGWRSPHIILLQVIHKMSGLHVKIISIKMQSFTNSHLIYDQLITDNETKQQQQTTSHSQMQPPTRLHPHKPFSIRKSNRTLILPVLATGDKIGTESVISMEQILEDQGEPANKAMEDQHHEDQCDTVNPEDEKVKNISVIHQEIGIDDDYCGGNGKNGNLTNKSSIKETIDLQIEEANQTSQEKYQSDFQQLQQASQNQQLQPPICHLKIPDSKQKTMPPGQNKLQPISSKSWKSILQNQIRMRKNNSLDRNSLHKKTTQLNSHSYSKSTIQLRRENNKMVQDIAQIRKYLPIVKKNYRLLYSQDRQIEEIKKISSKFFDIQYQFNLEKLVEGNCQMLHGVQSRIKQEESRIKYPFHSNRARKKDLLRLSLKRSRIESDDDDYDLPSELVKVREHLLRKKRQDEQNEKRIEELDGKIRQYQNFMTDLQERAAIGVHEELKRRKIVLEYDIELKKTQIQGKECQLMLEIAELNNKSSELEVEIARLQEQLTQIKTKSRVKSEQNINTTCETLVEIGTIEISGCKKKPMTRLLKLFQSKK